MSRSYDELTGLLRDAATLRYVDNLLSWDQETMMPAGGGEFRAEQIALLTRLGHERATAPRLGELLAACEEDDALRADATVAANLREIRRGYDRACRLTGDLAALTAETNSRAIEAWKRAREADDFSMFRPWLERQIDVARARAQAYGAPAGGESYDALVRDFEPDLTGADLERIFEPLRAELSELVAEIGEATSGSPPRDPLESLRLPVEDQRRFHRHVIERVGFDLTRGRLDVSTHPFSTSISPNDARITTRFNETRSADNLCATLHEVGHALYEQGRPTARYPGQPLSEHASLGIHESQSRLWENHVGRSEAFWDWALREARPYFGEAVAGLTGHHFFRSLNLVRPHAIRIESDETTYHLHVLLRFDLERALVRGDLAVADLPVAWNDRMKDDLGIEITRDAQGCLQDIHWAMGAIGYFPSYTLGSLYAAQLWEALTQDRDGIEEGLGSGEFAPILDWLGREIHDHGRRFTAPDLMRRATGNALECAPLLRHLRRKRDALLGSGSAAG